MRLVNKNIPQDPYMRDHKLNQENTMVISSKNGEKISGSDSFYHNTPGFKGILITSIALLLTGVACDNEPTGTQVVEAEPYETYGHTEGEKFHNAPETKSTNKLKVTARHPVGRNSADHPHATGDEKHYEFVLSDNEIDAGWTTIQFRNQSRSTHFVYLVKVPDDQAHLTSEEYMEEFGLPFQETWNPYYRGEITAGEFIDRLFATLPEWFHDAMPSGGVGLTGGRQTTATTVNLTEGTYFVECYILDHDGVFHTTHGMVEKLVVNGKNTGTSSPEGDLALSLSSANGIVFDDEVHPGYHTVEVIFENNMPYGHGLGHDVHLIRFDHGTTPDELNDWMSYLDVGADGFYADQGALSTSGDNPGPQTFKGGVQSIFAEEYPQSAYVHVTLKPGDYAWVSEVPNPMQPFPENPGVSLLKEFTVQPPQHAQGRGNH